MLTQYEEYMNRRAELIKQGWSLADATNQAFVDAYHKQIKSEDRIDPMSYADR